MRRHHFEFHVAVQANDGENLKQEGDGMDREKEIKIKPAGVGNNQCLEERQETTSKPG